MKKTLILLAWWFVVTHNSGWGTPVPKQIGPFPTKEACEKVRAELRHYSNSLTSCWNDLK